METLHTIATNLHALSQAHIDWSGNGGVPWLLAMAVGCPLFMASLSRSN